MARSRRARRRGWRACPVERSSTTSTSQPSASSRSTSVEPMNPAPPVTSALTSPRPRTGTRAPDSSRVRASTTVARTDDREIGDASHRARALRRRPMTASTASLPGPRRAPVEQRPNARRGHPPRRHRRGRRTEPAPRARRDVRRRRRAAPADRRGRRAIDDRHPDATRPVATRRRRPRAAVPIDRSARRACASRYFSGRADVEPVRRRSASANRRPGRSSMRGKVSRSIDTSAAAGCARGATARGRRCRR